MPPLQCPAKRLTSTGANRSTHADSAVRHTKSLGSIIAGINHADVIDLIFRSSRLAAGTVKTASRAALIAINRAFHLAFVFIRFY